MSAHTMASLHLLDGQGDLAPIKAKWTHDQRFVTINIGETCLLFNPAAFERFKAALCAVEVSAPTPKQIERAA